MLILRILAGLALFMLGLLYLVQSTVTVNIAKPGTAETKKYTKGFPLIMSRIAGIVMMLIGAVIWIFGFPHFW
ncbi:hypothetical protein R70723_08055 [Paenibacillus sp. FSL R7-0273]|uniref:hypothetical protein n=1 Tax=Paenibacillus sp. FSL R7-0273 TaxID=1536772 RepID=UPI0004F74C36|nr:hypothetical protein [Paenibacillus sp. FSL R7-0273]AIQ45837.1 hypothetical protein R70723_08055 [Paenibacillus sp. FSL R7-0273]OMF95366.1 hypothetical protein BK144_07570 [Paenibacillus sp. FSL R7-0273]